MKIGRILWKFGKFSVVDIIIEGADGLCSFVGGRDTGRTTKGHVPVAIPGPSFGGAIYRQRTEIPVEPVSDPKKVAYRGFHRGKILSIPVHPQDYLSPVKGFCRYGYPDVVDGTGAFNLGKSYGFTGGNVYPVVVSSCPVKGRNTFAREILVPAKILE
jgi:hypothetical protein